MCTLTPRCPASHLPSPTIRTHWELLALTSSLHRTHRGVVAHTTSPTQGPAMPSLRAHRLCATRPSLTRGCSHISPLLVGPRVHRRRGWHSSPSTLVSLPRCLQASDHLSALFFDPPIGPITAARLVWHVPRLERRACTRTSTRAQRRPNPPARASRSNDASRTRPLSTPPIADSERKCVGGGVHRARRLRLRAGSTLGVPIAVRL